MPLKSREFKHDSNTQVSFSNPNTNTIQGNTGGMTISAGTSVSDILTLANNSTAWPRTARTQTDFLTIGQNFTYPTGSAAAFNSIISSPAISSIDVASANLTTFQIAPTWTYTVAQSWGLSPKAGLNFTPSLISGLASAGSDTVIFYGINAQPQVNGSVGPRTFSNVHGLVGDPRMLGTAGTVTNMVGVRSRGNTIAGATATTFTAFLSDYSNPVSATTTTYRGLHISPSLLGTTTTFEGVKIEAQTTPSGSNIGFYQLGTAMHNRLQGYVRIGADSAPSHPLDVVDTNTGTSGTIRGTNIALALNPGSNSTSTSIGLDVGINTTATAFTKATNYWAGRFLASRVATDTGSIGSMVGLLLQAANSAPLSTGQGAITTQQTGAVFQAIDNSSTTTAHPYILGGQFNVNIGSNNVASRVYTKAEAGNFSVALGSGSTATTITTLNVVNVDAAVTGSLNRTGTITDARGVYVTGFTTSGVFGSGLTFTNAPAQIHLDSMSISGSMGIRQQGSTPHNRFHGKTSIGQDSAPTALLHLAAGTATANTAPIKLTSGTNLTAAEAGTIEYDGVRQYITSLSTATRQPISTVLHRDVTKFSYDTSAAETTIFTFTVPGGTLGTSGRLEARLFASVANSKGSSGTFILTAKYGATNLYVATHTIPNNNADTVELDVWLTGRGTTGTQNAFGRSVQGTSVNSIGVANNLRDELINVRELSEDSTADKVFTITATLSASSANFDFTFYNAVLKFV